MSKNERKMDSFVRFLMEAQNIRVFMSSSRTIKSKLAKNANS